MDKNPRRGALLALALAALLAACADPGAGPAGSGGQAAPASSTASRATAPVTTGVPAPSTSWPELPRDQVKVLVKGTVTNGVEPGCRLLDTGQGLRWLLLAGARDEGRLRPGARVEVVGVRATGQASTCQQGRPLQVLSVKPLP